jgi:hypothetical protein
MAVEFASGSFSVTAPFDSKLTEFVLDRPVDVTITLRVDRNDGGLQLVLKVRPPGGSPEIVMQTDVLEGTTPGSEATFDAVPKGIYSVAVVSLDGTAEGTFSARWENPAGAVKVGLDVGDPLSIPEEPQFDDSAEVVPGPDVPEVPLKPVDERLTFN